MKKLIVLLFVALIATGCGGNKSRATDRARKALDKRDYSRALAELNTIKQEDEIKTPEVQYLLGKTYLGLSNLQQSQTYFKSVLAKDPSYRDSIALAYKKRGLELGKVGEKEKALECFEQSMRTSAIDMSDAYVLMGEIYAKYGELGRSAHYYRLALKILGDSTIRALTWEKLIKITERLGNAGDAFLTSEKALYEKHYHLQSYYCENGYSYAQDLLHRGKLDSADLVISRVLQVQLSPMLKDDIYFLAGEIKLKNGDIEGAVAAYKEVLKLNLNASNALIQRARKRLSMLGVEVE